MWFECVVVDVVLLGLVIVLVMYDGIIVGYVVVCGCGY